MNHHKLILDALTVGLKDIDGLAVAHPVFAGPEKNPRRTITVVNLDGNAFKLTLETIKVCDKLLPTTEYEEENHD
jgi:hypothetical protein